MQPPDITGYKRPREEYPQITNSATLPDYDTLPALPPISVEEEMSYMDDPFRPVIDRLPNEAGSQVAVEPDFTVTRRSSGFRPRDPRSGRVGAGWSDM